MAGTKPVLIGAVRGVRNDVPAEDMLVADKEQGTDLAAAVNVDINDAGGWARRAGFTELVAAAGLHSLYSTPDGATTLVVQGTALKRLEGAALVTLAQGLTAGAPMSYATDGARTFHCNGVESGVYEAGRVRAWGLDRAPDPALAAAAGALPPGTYAVVATYVTEDGQQSGAGSGTQLALPDGGGLSVGLTASSDPRVNRIRLWMTAADGATFYLAATLANATQTALLAAPSILAQPLTTLHLGPPPTGHLVAVYRAHALVAAGSRLHYSSPFGLELFRATDFHDLGAHITMLAPTLDGVYVGTTEGCWWLGGEAPAAFAARRLDDAAPIEGTLAIAPAKRVFGTDSELGVPVWFTADGPTVGLPGGALRTLNRRYRPTVADRGAGLVRQAGESFQYVASFGENL